LVFAAVRPGSAATLPSAGLRLNASKSEPVPEGGDFPLHTFSRVRIGFGPGPQQVGDGRYSELCACWLTNCNFNVRRDKSFVDDLVAATGRVPSRVALSLRASERQPECPWFVGGLSFLG
jgi:hypothetical protein